MIAQRKEGIFSIKNMSRTRGQGNKSMIWAKKKKKVLGQETHTVSNRFQIPTVDLGFRRPGNDS